MSLQCMANAADVGHALQRRWLLDHPAGREAGCKKSSCMGMSHALWSGESQGSEGHGETRKRAIQWREGAAVNLVFMVII